MTKLTLGPIAYHWTVDERRDFYARIADEAAVDEVYLGEVICSKRAPFHEVDLPITIDRLERAGKTVILSSLAEVVLKRERKATEDLAAMDSPEIEFNNAAIHFLDVNESPLPWGWALGGIVVALGGAYAAYRFVPTVRGHF